MSNDRGVTQPNLDYDTEFRPQLAKIGLSVAQFARETGYRLTVVYDWKTATNGVPHWVRSWLQLRELAARWHRLAKSAARNRPTPPASSSTPPR